MSPKSDWVAKTAKRHDLTHTIRPEGRPAKSKMEIVGEI